MMPMLSCRLRAYLVLQLRWWLAMCALDKGRERRDRAVPEIALLAPRPHLGALSAQRIFPRGCDRCCLWLLKLPRSSTAVSRPPGLQLSFISTQFAGLRGNEEASFAPQLGAALCPPHVGYEKISPEWLRAPASGWIALEFCRETRSALALDRLDNRRKRRSKVDRPDRGQALL